jgi:L-aspartate oxidase
VLRNAQSLAQAAAGLLAVGEQRSSPRTATWEVTNLVTLAAALVASASRRAETRGCHWRDDFPEARRSWLGHLVTRINPDGCIDQTWEPLP